MVEWSIEAFRAAGAVQTIVVAVPPGHVGEVGGQGLTVVSGGETRVESVSNALVAVGTELVAVHDAARPLVTPELIEALVAALMANPEAAGVVPAAAVADTIKRADSGEQVAPASPSVAAEPPFSMHDRGNGGLVVETTLDRAGLWAAQTPQVFRTEALRAALAADPERVAAATDEAMLVEAAGGRVLIHPSPAENIKVTTPIDLKLAELLLAERAAA